MKDAMSAHQPAPRQLDLVIDFVNTRDIEAGTEELSTPAALARWLAARRLLDPAGAVSERELAATLRLREALRAVMLAHNGGPEDAAAERELEAVARRGRLEVQFPSADSLQLAPREAGVAGALASLLAPVAHAIGDGSWRRVKACRAGNCQWAFYDRSRNRSGTWCDMAVCGNRTKVRAYRRRGQRAAPPAQQPDA
jgi:predicted RNA-binding Zn ribbon-like protein